MDESPFSMMFSIIENEGKQKPRFLISVAEKTGEGFFQHPIKVQGVKKLTITPLIS